MAEYTTNYNLEKQQGNDNVNINGINNNFDIIDSEIKNAQDKADKAFQSASDGKQKIATAITGKGVPTGSNDTFQKMADNIESIETDPSIGTTDAVAADILAPRKVVSQGKLIIGTMPNWGPTVAETVNLTDNNQHYSIAAGYHSGLRIIKAVITGLTANVIKAGTTVGGIVGTFTSDANAIASQILAGSIAYVQGLKVVGTMPNRGAVNQNLAVEGQEFTIPQGYHNGLGKIKAVISGLVASVIKTGATVGGIAGNFTADATATAAQMLQGAIAYVKGNKITGTIPSKGAQTYTPGTTNQVIGAGQYLSGNQIIQGSYNLIPENIKENVNLFGKIGTLKPIKNFTASDILLKAGSSRYDLGGDNSGSKASGSANTAFLFYIEKDTRYTDAIIFTGTGEIFINTSSYASGWQKVSLPYTYDTSGSSRADVRIFNPYGVTITINVSVDYNYIFIK